MRESQTTKEKCMEQFVNLLKKDIENFEVEPEQMKRFMTELSSRIKETDGRETAEEKE